MTPHDERPVPTRVGHGRLVAMYVLGLLVIGAAMVAASAIIHLYLWGKEDGYRNVPTIGPMFLVQGIVGCLLAVAVVIERRVITAFAGAVYMAASIAALVKTINGGMFDFNETLDAPYVKPSLVVEIIGLTAFAVAMVILLQSKESTAEPLS